METSNSKKIIQHTVERTIIEKRDKQLVDAVCKGDSYSFAKLVGCYKRKVHALGYSFFRNETDAEDFVQDVFLKVYTKINTFRGESLFSTWLMRVAYNIAINSVKRRKEYATLTDEINILDTDFGPEDRQLRILTAQAIREAIKELPENYAVCLDMYFFYDMPYTEISEVTEIPVNTIKSHIFRAKKILRDKLVAIV